MLSALVADAQDGYAGIQDWWNRKGPLSGRGERKQAFDVLRSFYDEVAGDWRPSPLGF